MTTLIFIGGCITCCTLLMNWNAKDSDLDSWGLDSILRRTFSSPESPYLSLNYVRLASVRNATTSWNCCGPNSSTWTRAEGNSICMCSFENFMGETIRQQSFPLGTTSFTFGSLLLTAWKQSSSLEIEYAFSGPDRLVFDLCVSAVSGGWSLKRSGWSLIFTRCKKVITSSLDLAGTENCSKDVVVQN